MNLKSLALEIKKKSQLTGNFKLRSGQTSSLYFDKYQFESDPDLLNQITDHFIPFIPSQTQLLGGLELGGIPLASVLSVKTKIPCVFIRKKAKEYGTQKQAEGPCVDGKIITLIEDVVTTGGAVFEATQALRNSGGIVHQVLCVINRGAQLSEWESKNLKLKSLFHLDDF